MPAFASSQLESTKIENRSRVRVGYNHPLNNPSRPEFATAGTAARALFGHALSTLKSTEPGVAQSYWGELKSLITRASRNITEEKQISLRRGAEVNIAQASLDDMLNDEQLKGGTEAALARRDLYSALPENISRREKQTVIAHLTARALGEIVNAETSVKRPGGALGRIAEGLTQSEEYARLRTSIDQIYTNTQANPVSEIDYDLDAMEDEDRAEVLRANEGSRVTKTQDVIRSFADSFLTETIDVAETRAAGEDTLANTIFEMETSQEATVIEAIANWAQKASRENGGRLPTAEQIDAGFKGVFEDLSKVNTMTIEQRAVFDNNGLVARLSQDYLAGMIINRLYPPQKDEAGNAVSRKFTGADIGRITDTARTIINKDDESRARYAQTRKLLGSIQGDRAVTGEGKWLLIEKSEVAQRKPIFGKGSSQFEHLKATGLFPARFFKDTKQIADIVNGTHAANDKIRNKAAIVVPNNESDAVKAAIAAAQAAGMPVINVVATYTRDSIMDRENDQKITMKETTYSIRKEDGTEVPMFSREGYRLTNGALMLVDGRGSTDKQSEMIKLDVFADMSHSITVMGLGAYEKGRADYAAANVFQKGMVQNKISAVLDDSGRPLDTEKAFEITKPVTLSPLDMAKARLEAKMGTEELNAPVSSVHARLLVHEMNISNRSKEDLSKLASIDATIGDLMKLPAVAADAGKGLSDQDRAKFKDLAAAVGVDNFRQGTLDDVKRISTAADRAYDSIAQIKESGLGIVFDGPGTAHGPVVTAGQGKLSEMNSPMLLVGGKAEPSADQKVIIDQTVQTLAREGHTIVTTAAPGFNVEVMEAALKHRAPIVVVTPEDISRASQMPKEVASKVLDIAFNHDAGVAIGTYQKRFAENPELAQRNPEMADKARAQWNSVQPRYDALERNAIELAGSMSNAVVMGFARETEYVAYATAKLGADKPVAVLPGGLDDTANHLLSRNFQTVAVQFDRYGTSTTSSFVASENNGEQQKTERDKDSGLVLGGPVATRSRTWDNAAEHVMRGETISDFVERFSVDVEQGKVPPMVNAHWTERDRMVAMGLDTPTISGDRIEMDFNDLPADDRQAIMDDKIVQLNEYLKREQIRVKSENRSRSRGAEVEGIAV